MTVIRPKPLATALLLFLLAGTTVPGQQYGRERAPLPVPRVTLNASPASISPGRPVTFVAHLTSSYPNIRFRFVFGDGGQTNWQPTPVATHAYQTAGNYQPFVDIGAASGGGVTRLGGSVRRLVQVTQAPAGPVDLMINPATAHPGRSVALTARTGSNNPNLRYRFSYGDGARDGGWQSSPQALHVYAGPGTYTASVDVALITNRGIQHQATAKRSLIVSAAVASERVRASASSSSSTSRKGTGQSTSAKTKTSQTQESATTTNVAAIRAPSPATPSPTISPDGAQRTSGFAQPTASNDWRSLWLLVPLVLLVLILGKWIFGRPAVVGHADSGSSSVVDSTGLVSKTEVVTPASASQSQREVSSSGPLVKNVRREDG
ncbi:MAG TPA: PKD domain-containing protein [Pyrinomonadaceae bacterium]|nr:PKD domain-containing protein [Pyrinomonadaceae bacterium]